MESRDRLLTATSAEIIRSTVLEAVVHLRRPAGIDLHLLVAAEKLRGNVAFP